MEDQKIHELKEVGISFEETPDDLVVVFGVGINNKNEYDTFDYAIFKKDLDVPEEYDWADLKAVASCSGLDLDSWEKMPLQRQLEDLYFYYGRLNVFGETYQVIDLNRALDLLTD